MYTWEKCNGIVWGGGINGMLAFHQYHVYDSILWNLSYNLFVITIVMQLYHEPSVIRRLGRMVTLSTTGNPLHTGRTWHCWVVSHNIVLSHAFSPIKFINTFASLSTKGMTKQCSLLTNSCTRYKTGHYISSSEAAWRILCFPIHEQFPSVMQLAVHLRIAK